MQREKEYKIDYSARDRAQRVSEIVGGEKTIYSAAAVQCREVERIYNGVSGGYRVGYIYINIYFTWGGSGNDIPPPVKKRQG